MFLLPLLLTVFDVVHAALPLVDFDRMGAVGLAGAFAGLDFYSNTSQSLNPTASTLLIRSNQGALTYVASTDSGGRVLSSCTMNGIVYLAGSFSVIGDVQLPNVASYDPSSGSFTPLGATNSGPNGPVDVIFCDEKENKLWLGGNFTFPGRAVALYDIKSKSWSAPPFVGFTGAQDRVLSITMNATQTSLFFAGSFITSFQGTGSPLPNGKNNPNVPFSAGASPFSSSLVPVPIQNAQVLGSPSTSLQGFTDIHAILCPAGDDGPGNTWFGQDGSPALITIRTFSFISAGGIRLGNTFQSNHGTTEFSVTTIPDNTVQTLQYTDPISGQAQTCTTCPLSNNASLLYQDFLFANPLSITGIQVKISAFSGASPGLHILQILSSGAFASAVGNNNGQSCYAPNPSNITLVGSWQTQEANTGIPGTTQQVLVSSIDVGAPSSSGPSITWMPYVSAAGNYDINLLVPGCANLQDCGSRTSVKVTVFPGEGKQPSVTTLSQTNQQDVVLPVYSGPVSPTSSSFVLTITMTFADVPSGAGENGKYDIVADRVQLVLKSVNGSTGGTSNSTTTNNGVRSGFGFFEWPLGGNAADATTTLSNSSETPLDSVGVQLFDGIGVANSSMPIAINAVVHTPNAIFLGGNFSLPSGSASGSANIVTYKAGSLNGLADNGLNGAVVTIITLGNTIYVGGSFSDTASGSTQGKLRGVARYDLQLGQWHTLGGGVNGPVTHLEISNNKLLVAGSFTKAFLGGDDLGLDTAGLAVWDIVNGAWINSGGFLISQLDLITNITSTEQLLAGNVSSIHKYGASGMIMVNNGGTDGPVVTPLGIQLESNGSSNPLTSSINNARRHWHAATTPWNNRVHLFPRQSPPSGQLAPLPPLPPATAPAVLAGAFWANNSKEVVIIGGNFSYPTNPPVNSLGIYDPKNSVLQGVSGAQINGTVRALFVDNNKLYVGGQFGLANSNANGLAVYDLSANSWTATSLQPLQGDTVHPVVIKSITKSLSSNNAIIVAGSFTSAGALSCAAICSFDASTLQWNMLGNGITGEVASVAYAGTNQDVLIVAGSLKLSDGTVAAVARYSLNNGTWTVVGSSFELPGPVTAVEVDDGNENSLFAAGRSSDNSTTFLSFWNGSNWRMIDSTLESNSSIGQLTIVPLQNTHASNGVIEPDRALMISGLLNSPSFNYASAAIFDGQTLVPYIVATSSSGTAGYVSSLFYSISNFSFIQRQFLATGVVILISIAISAGVVFLLALVGILWTLFSRRDEKVNKFDAVEDDDDSSLQHRPSSLLEHINAATRTTILGASPHSNFDPDKEEEKIDRDGLDEAYGPDASNYIRAQTPSDAMGGMAPEEVSRPAHARYSFDGDGEGELPISAGAELEVLDDRDPSWWYARDVQTGREGVVPAAFLY